MFLKGGTYARERDGATDVYYSPTRWNNASYGLERYLADPHSVSSLYAWERVTGDRLAQLWKEHPLQPGEYVEVPYREGG